MSESIDGKETNPTQNQPVESTNVELERKLNTLQEISSVISSTLDLDKVMKLILDSMYKILGFEYCTVSLVDWERQVVEGRYFSHKGQFGASAKWAELSTYPLDHWDIQADIVRSGKTEIIGEWDDRFNKEIWDKWDHDQYIRIFIPIKSDDVVVGTIEAGHYKRKKQHISDDEIQTLQALVDQTAIVVRNAQLYDRIQQRAKQLTALEEVGHALTSGIRMPQDEILELIHDKASDLMDTDNMYIALYDKSTNIVRFGLAFLGGERVDVANDPVWQPRRGGTGRTEYIIDTRKPTLTASRSEAEAWYSVAEHREYIGTELASYLGVPMIAGEKVLGVIATYHPTKDYVYSEDDLEILQMMANQAAIALDNANMFYDINQRFRALVDFGRAITSRISLSEEEIIEMIHTQASKMMDTGNMYVALYDESADEVSFGLAYVDDTRVDIDTDKGYRPRIGGKGKTEIIIQTRNPIIHATIADAEAWYAEPGHEEYVGKVLPSWLGVPIMVGENVLGVIATYHPEREYVYDGDDLIVLQAIADQAAVAITNTRFYSASLEEEKQKRLEAEQWAQLGRLAGSLAHRIGNKGGMIRLCVQELSDNLANVCETDDWVWKQLRTIERNNQYLLNLSEFLFKPAQAVKEGSVSIFVDMCIEESLRVAEIPEGTEVVIEIPDQLPPVVGNKYLIEAFHEVIVNAFDAMRSSQDKRLTIDAKSQGNYVEVRFSDTGPGLFFDEPDMAFEIFARGTDEKLSKEGQGFGLWWVRTFLRDLDGDIWYESDPEKGTTFTARIPAWEENHE